MALRKEESTPSLCPITDAALMPKDNFRKPEESYFIRHSVVNSNYNLPSKQRRTQQLVAQFNADEELWLSLESKRRRRRKVHPRMSGKLKRELDLLEFARVRPPQDCLGFWQTNTDRV
jgi:hypothetical protein